MRKIKLLLTLAVILGIWSCEPFEENKPLLGDPPVASFDISAGATPNDFTLTNTTSDVFIVNWVVESLGTFEGETVDVQLNSIGDYMVTLTVFNDGGHDSTSQIISVTQDGEQPCIGNIELLTNCSSKVWKLAFEANALHVGPNATETWWGNSEDDLDARACIFNDEYIFNEDLSYEYDNKGDFWADADGDGNIWPADLGLPVGCNDASLWPSQYQAWNSGVHNFSTLDNTLTLSGDGAHLGLYKVATNAEVSQPQSSVSYQIMELTSDRMVLIADHNGVVWRYTLSSN